MALFNLVVDFRFNQHSQLKLLNINPHKSQTAYDFCGDMDEVSEF